MTNTLHTTTATTITTATATTDPRVLFTRALDTAGVTIARISPDQLAGPTPCDAFDVRALLGHVVMVLERVALLGEGGDPMSVTERAVVADDVWDGAYADGVARLQAAWADDATLTTIMTLPWVQAPGAAMLGMYTAELTVHTWDLATATGQQPAWDDETVTFALQAALQALPQGDREAAFAAIMPHLPPAVAANGRPFGNPVESTEQAPLIDQLVAWYGRNP